MEAQFKIKSKQGIINIKIELMNKKLANKLPEQSFKTVVLQRMNRGYY